MMQDRSFGHPDSQVVNIREKHWPTEGREADDSSQLLQGLWSCYQRHYTSLNGMKQSTVEEGTQEPQGMLVEPGESQADAESSIRRVLDQQLIVPQHLSAQTWVTL
uniref:Uncharacterized protein n=1 Tax=Romanomermis culicivorax TaxID=13658 RepID=A0A915JQZ5_ROMCU